MPMGDVIGRLSVTLGLDTAAFETNAKRAVKTTATTGENMEALGSKVRIADKALVGLGAAIAGSQLLGTIKDLAVQGLEYASSLGEQAQQLGVLSSELQEYRYAASQSGVATETMDQALAQLTKRIGLAANGAKGPAGAFKELGISIRDARGNMITAGQAIPLIAEALAKIPEPAKRARLEAELFGKSGQQLDPLLTQGAKGVNDLRTAAHNLGIVLSEETIAKADKAADHLGELNTVLQAKVAGVVSENANAIIRLADSLAKLADGGLKAMTMLNKFLDSPAGKFTIGAINPDVPSLVELRKRQMNAAAAEPAPAPQSSVGKGAPVKVPSKLAKPVNGWSVWNGQTTFRLGGGQQFSNAFDRLTGVAPGAISDVLQISNAEPEFSAAMDKMRKALDGVGKSADDLEGVSGQAARGVRDGWVGTAQGVIGALNQMAYAFKGGDFLDMLGALVGLGLQLGQAGVFGKDFAGKVSGIPAYAGGTSWHPGGMALVGERGPELVNLPRGSSVIPNHALGGAGSGNTYNFTGNLMTPEFWAQIQAGDQRAAAAGAQGGAMLVAQRNSRRLM